LRLTRGVGEIVFSGSRVSRDGGATWSRLWTSGIALAVDPANRRTVYLATLTGLLVSHDSGLHFEPLGSGIRGALVTTLAVDPQRPSRILAGTQDAGVFASEDSGLHWSPLSAGLGRPRLLVIQSIEAQPLQRGRFFLSAAGRLFAATLDD